MRQFLVAVGLLFGLLSGSGARALDGTDATKHYAVITPLFLGTQSAGGSQSFIRLFNGKVTGSSTFTVTVVGQPSGRVMGNALTLPVPKASSIQYSIQEITSFASAGSFTNGDSNYALYVQNSDNEAGFQHAVYDWSNNYFENASNCTSTINEQMLALHNALVIPSVHTSKAGGGNFPSTIVVHNYGPVAANYELDIYHAGDHTAGVANTFIANSGKHTCGFQTGSIASNGSRSFNFQTGIETTTGECKIDSDQTYANIVLTNLNGGPPNATVQHNIRVSAFNGVSNFSAVCAINKVANAQITATSKFQGVIAGTNSQSGTFAVTVTGTTAAGSLIVGGTTSALTGTYNAATNGLTVSGGGFTFTGAVAGSTYNGQYTGTNSNTGAFSSLNSTLSAVTAYCGTFTVPGAGTGLTNVVIAANGTMAGAAIAEDGVALTGQVTGTSLAGFTASGDATFTGTVVPGQSVSGTVSADIGNGTFTTNVCAVP
jgi:hypothetical protein